MSNLVYPSPTADLSCDYDGLLPVDFVLETIIEAGLLWFRSTPDASNMVFGQLLAPWLEDRYGQSKIDEIGNFINKYEIKIVQHFSLIATNAPCFSIQILDANEREDRAGLADFSRMVDVLNDSDGAVVGRTEQGYAAISDNIHIGIHNVGTPDLTKYLYYFLIYILNVFKPQLEERGLHLSSFRATDISRLNDFLPENMYSRFVNFSVFSMAPFSKGSVPILENILGVHADPEVPDNELGGVPAGVETK